ncbi:MBL fold metallo-hydrolase [Anaerococcus sp. AGMB09787]|uniref:MBL fold metallo-hydrolase n=1 Tax=Anaerococcus sp. AGMB09787 TaxID=2922869 RepID=UPI001FAF5C05|nr:MBL fold metallo-hydrolase [Anaerococcus sp. AGMB09787]
MKLIRHVHACVEFVKDGKHIFIDPGEFGLPDNLQEASAILITHDHFDHVSISDVKKCYENNKNLKIYGTKSFANKVDFPVISPQSGDIFDLDGFKIQAIKNYQDIANLNDPPIENIGYIIDDKVLHPGDCLPKIKNIDTILLPLAAPWAKTIDIQKYLREYRPKVVLPIHDLILNELGVNFKLKNMEELSKEVEASFYPLKVGDSIDI